MKLYSFPLSGHAHRAELFLSLAKIDHEVVHLDLPSGAHKRPEFLKKNIFGQVPVLEDEGIHIADSHAIMVYLAKKYDLRDWYPDDARGAAEVQRWLAISAGPLAYGPAAARLITLFGAKLDPEVITARAHKLFGTVEAHLVGRQWLASDAHPTIADVAFYSYAHHAPEGNVDLSAYPNVQALLSRIESLPGFVEFVESPVGLRAPSVS